jgi:hypothetical protein
VLLLHFSLLLRSDHSIANIIQTNDGFIDKEENLTNGGNDPEVLTGAGERVSYISYQCCSLRIVQIEDGWKDCSLVSGAKGKPSRKHKDTIPLKYSAEKAL